MDSPDFYAIIPADVRYDRSLKPNAKLLYGEITALCNKEGFCWADNGYFADLYQVSKETISRWISQLELAKYLKLEHYPEKGNSRKIYLNSVLTKKSIGLDKKVNRVLTKKSIGIDKRSILYMRILQLIIQLIRKRKMLSLFLSKMLLLNGKIF